MRHLPKYLPMTAIVMIFVAIQFPIKAEERYLDALGRIQTRYDSLNELKPLLTLRVLSPTEWPGEINRKVSDEWAEPVAQAFAGLRQLEETLLAEGGTTAGGRLTSLLADVSLAESFQVELFLGRDAIYPVVLFPTKSEHAVPNQTLTLKKLAVPYSGGREIGFAEFCWGAQGRWGYVTTPQIGALIEQALADPPATLIHGGHGKSEHCDPQPVALPSHTTALPFHDATELASLTVYCENFPPGPLQFSDVLTTLYSEAVPMLVGSSSLLDFLVDIDFSGVDDSQELLGVMAGMSLYSAIVKYLRAIGEGVRQFDVRAVMARESGDLIVSATTEYQPHGDLARQNQVRRDHRQTLAGFYQPEHAIFAFAEGVAPRLEEKSFLAGLGHLYSMVIDASVGIEVPDGFDRAVLDDFIGKTLFPSLLADWQEVAVTVDHDASILASMRVTDGQYAAELMDACLKYVELQGGDVNFFNDHPGEIHPQENYNGYRLFRVTVPIPTHKTIYGRSVIEQEDGTETVIEGSNTRIRAEWLDGKSLTYCLAISDEVAAFALGLSPVDATQRLKDAIDRNAAIQEHHVQNFPETTLVFTTPTEEQLQTLAVLFNEENWWEKQEFACEENASDELESIPRTDEAFHSTDWSIRLSDRITIRSLSPPANWPVGNIRVQSTLTDTSRTDKVRIGAEFWGQ